MLIRKCVAKLNQKGASIKKTPSISIQDGEARKLETRLKTNKTHFAKGNTHATESTRRGQGLFERANIGHAGDFRGVCVGVDVDSDRRRTTEELQCCVPRQSWQQRETQGETLDPVGRKLPDDLSPRWFHRSANSSCRAPGCIKRSRPMF